MTRNKHARTRPETPAQWAERTRREQGLPAMITDPAVLERIGVFFAQLEALRAPDSVQARRIEAVVTLTARPDDHVV